MEIFLENPVCVIIPSIGQPTLIKALESIYAQTYGSVYPLVVIDGNEHFSKVMDLNLPIHTEKNLTITTAPYNTGANGFYGHRIYAAYPHLVNQDYICFLDEDNWFEPNHIETMVEKLETRRP